MKILLTGHQGFIGSKLDSKLTDNGHEVFGFDCNLPYSEWYKKFHEFLLIHDRPDFDLIIHCGAIADSTAKGDLLWDLNFKTTTYLANIASNFNTKFLFFSSAAAIDPVTEYGRTKWCTELAVRNIMQPSQQCILRPFNVWGFDEHKKENPSIIHKIMNFELKRVYANFIRDFIHVDAVVNAVCNIVEEWQPNGVFELGSCIGIEIRKLVDAIYNELDHKHIQNRPPLVIGHKYQKRLVARMSQTPSKWDAASISNYTSQILNYIRQTDYEFNDPYKNRD